MGRPSVIVGGRHDDHVTDVQYRVASVSGFPSIVAVLLEAASASRNDVELLIVVVVDPVDGRLTPPIANDVESDGMSSHLEAGV